MGKPHSSTFGLRVSKITIRTGTKKILRSVNPFGRFISAERRKLPLRPFPPPSLTIDSSYAGVNVAASGKGCGGKYFQVNHVSKEVGGKGNTFP